MDAKLFDVLHKQPIAHAIFTEYMQRSAGIDERLLVEHIPEEVLIEMIVALSNEINNYRLVMKTVLEDRSFFSLLPD